MSGTEGAPEVYFFGCLRQAGHFLWSSSLRHSWDLMELVGRETGRPLDPGFCPGSTGLSFAGRRDQVEGHAGYVRRGGWTGLCWWDRSVDSRYNSNGQFWARGDHTAMALLQLGFAAFPDVQSRIGYTIEVVTHHDPEPA